MSLEFSRRIFGKLQITNFMKICLVGAAFFHADGQDEANTSFSYCFELAWRSKKCHMFRLLAEPSSGCTASSYLFHMIRVIVTANADYFPEDN